MGVLEENVLPIRLVRKRHHLPHLALFSLTHSLKCRLILLIQLIIVPPQPHEYETQGRQRRHDTCLPRYIPRSLFGLESLRAKDIADAERDHGHGVSGHFLRVASDVRRIPCKQQHEGCAERARQV